MVVSPWMLWSMEESQSFDDWLLESGADTELIHVLKASGFSSKLSLKNIAFQSPDASLFVSWKVLRICCTTKSLSLRYMSKSTPTGCIRSKMTRYVCFILLASNLSCEEHHDIQVNQIKRVPSDISVYSDEVYYEYQEFISKNNQHRFKDINATNISVRVYAIGKVFSVIRLLDQNPLQTFLPSTSDHWTKYLYCW